MVSIYDVLEDTTRVFRKGAEVTQHPAASGVQVTEVFGYPHYEGPEANDLELVDLHFVVVGVDKAKAQARKAELEAWLAGYPEPERLAGGPSYIEFAPAAEMEQEGAFRVFALGEVLGLWSIITPEKIGFTGPEADQLAGTGLVMTTGYKVPAAT